MGMLDALQITLEGKQMNAGCSKRQPATQRLYNSISKTLRIMVQSAAIATGAYLALKQEISPGMIIGGSILIGRALQPVELAVSAWKGFLDAKEQYGRLEGLLSAFPREGAKMALPDITGKVSARSHHQPAGLKSPSCARRIFRHPQRISLYGARAKWRR